MSDELVKKLVDEYYASRPNLEVSHSPLCILFFACTGSGKSTTRRMLVDKLDATYVCNDEVKDLLAKYPDAIEQGIELKTIVAETVERIFAESPNKLIVFDNNIIQYYMHEDSYINVAKAKQRPVFIIGLEASEDVLVRRIKECGIDVARLLGVLPDQLKDYEKATEDLRPDWTVKTTGNHNEPQELINYLQTVLAK